MIVAETHRLVLRRLTADDAVFICRLLNEPSWLQSIGDRGVRTLADAATYIQGKMMAAYQSLGSGMYLVESKSDGTALGICGLVQRESLPDPDIGFAFVPEHWHKGYAREASSAVMVHAHELRFAQLLAIVAPANAASRKLVEKLGFRFQKLMSLNPSEPALCLYAAEV